MTAIWWRAPWRATPAGALDALRFVLAVEVDHTPFLRLAASDPLLAAVVRRRPGLRPARLGTVAHALVRAVCGQLITAREAMQIERRLLAAICAPVGRAAPAAGGVRNRPPERGPGRAGGALAAAGGGARAGRPDA